MPSPPTSDGVTAWLAPWSRGVVASVFGDPVPSARLLAALLRDGALASVRRVTLPRVDHAVLDDRLAPDRL